MRRVIAGALLVVFLAIGSTLVSGKLVAAGHGGGEILRDPDWSTSGQGGGELL